MKNAFLTAALAVILGFTATTLNTATAYAAEPPAPFTNPWADDSVCEQQDMYNEQGYAAWQGDLCNQYEVEKALFYEKFLAHVFQGVDPRAIPSKVPCTVALTDAFSYAGNSWGTDDVGGSVLRNVWYNANGVVCPIGSDAQVAANPFNSMASGITDPITGETLAPINVAQAWVSWAATQPDRAHWTLDEDGNPVRESIRDFDCGFVNKRYPGAEICVVE